MSCGMDQYQDTELILYKIRNQLLYGIDLFMNFA